MTIKILIFILGLIYVCVAIKIIIKIYKDTKRADEIIEQLIMELVWSQHRQENVEALEQEPCDDCIGFQQEAQRARRESDGE